MARAESLTKERQPLYERDFCLWVEEQVRLLRQGSFERLDVANLVEEIEDLGIGAKKAVKSTDSGCATISQRARACAVISRRCFPMPMPTPAPARSSRPGCPSWLFRGPRRTP
jgi:Domain of unknown function DUF29